MAPNTKMAVFPTQDSTQPPQIISSIQDESQHFDFKPDQRQQNGNGPSLTNRHAMGVRPNTVVTLSLS